MNRGEKRQKRESNGEEGRKEASEKGRNRKSSLVLNPEDSEI